MKSLDAVIEEYRKRMFSIAKEDGISAQRTLVASQNLDEILNIEMNKNNPLPVNKKK
ncbi:aspartyl-phosphate phosphatase Spo0E family protein [Metabacillus litoralis]|uniref:aspartyl-phosphate phosphatase Spo0E family protein n=1 Tax=Metabacillus TaxID=2675233 RepID=UPI000EF5CA5B|nr:aspartyl-phosphate phosphatase Spo0E family protein [Metabacillus litoralis]MCM3160121.1 aspartyl-phosphate phosphatase Spo0E family protein [Metabacillus litoralis]MCM3408706.1 aspartyl-phosphate phosphatase Spo0E family protein [Metabacillus litoralis]UHA59632.1 aspartyl-phosphate phosphatase Spo0E family protein [Metabacillus litoralis]